jgi:hypothetical protein
MRENEPGQEKADLSPQFKALSASIRAFISVHQTLVIPMAVKRTRAFTSA